MRRLARLVVSLFTISTIFPVVAGLARFDRAPLWLGVADVVMAGALVLSALTLAARTRARADARASAISLGIYRSSANLPVALLVLFFLVGHRVDWNVLLVGLGWRFWLFWYVLPGLVSALLDDARGTAAPTPSSI